MVGALSELEDMTIVCGPPVNGFVVAMPDVTTCGKYPLRSRIRYDTGREGAGDGPLDELLREDRSLYGDPRELLPH